MNGVSIKNLFIIYIFFALLALCAIIKIIYVQYISPSDITGEKISFKNEIIEPVRGDILSIDGKPLATSIPYYQIRMDCVAPHADTFKNNIVSLSKELSKLYKNKSAKAIQNELTASRKAGERYVTIGNRLIDYGELEKLKKFPIFKLGPYRGGLIVQEKHKRTNPYGRLAYRTIGFINSNGVGVGIEGSHDYFLKGVKGKQDIQKVLGGEWIPIYNKNSVPQIDGYDIKTTLDIGIQEATERALREQITKSSNDIEGGTAIVMDVETGAIRAIANMKKSKGGYDESYNYAIGSATEPGSVFKLATLIALLEDNHVTLDSPIDAGNGKWRYGSFTYSDITHGGYGMISVKEAFAKSSNVAFAKMVVENYENDQKRFTDRVQGMKIGEKFNLDIQGEARATIYSPEDGMWSKTTMPSMAIGYATLLTPLHVLTFYNAVANNGTMVKPYFIDSYLENGKVIEQFNPQEVSGAICSKSTLKMVQEALLAVVEGGTGKSLRSKNYQIAGKTGTARVAYGGKIGYEKNGYRRYQASFVGYFPADNPQYTALVVLYSGDTRGNFYGGSQSGPVFKQIADYIYTTNPDWNSPIIHGKQVIPRGDKFPEILAGNLEATTLVLDELNLDKEVENNLVETDWAKFKRNSDNITESHPCKIDDGVLMDVRDMGVKDAVYLLENMGYRVVFSGFGKVVKQTPKAGTKLKKNSIVKLQLEDNGA